MFLFLKPSMLALILKLSLPLTIDYNKIYEGLSQGVVSNKFIEC